jgi:YHS domain-containing protein
MTVVIVIFILLAVFFFLKSMGAGPRKRRFQGPRFSEIRKDVDRGTLHRDPISGTYVSESDAIVVERNGEKYYFGSEENAERFRRGEEQG